MEIALYKLYEFGNDVWSLYNFHEDLKANVILSPAKFKNIYYFKFTLLISIFCFVLISIFVRCSFDYSSIGKYWLFLQIMIFFLWYVFLISEKYILLQLKEQDQFNQLNYLVDYLKEKFLENKNENLKYLIDIIEGKVNKDILQREHIVFFENYLNFEISLNDDDFLYKIDKNPFLKQWKECLLNFYYLQ